MIYPASNLINLLQDATIQASTNPMVFDVINKIFGMHSTDAKMPNFPDRPLSSCMEMEHSTMRPDQMRSYTLFVRNSPSLQHDAIFLNIVIGTDMTLDPYAIAKEQKWTQLPAKQSRSAPSNRKSELPLFCRPRDTEPCGASTGLSSNLASRLSAGSCELHGERLFPGLALGPARLILAWAW